MRIRCWFFGCEESDEPQCYGCHSDYEFRQKACWIVEVTRAIVYAWRSNRYHRSHPCDVCGHQMHFTDEACCSEECYGEWNPF